MKYAWCPILLVAAVLTTNSPSASAESASQARQEIQATLAKRALARQKKNLNDYMATFTPDWTTTNVGGRVVSYETLKQSMAQNFNAAPITGVIHSQLTEITIHGNSAQVKVETWFDYPAQRTASGLVYPYKDTVASETWIKNRSAWQEKRERYLVDNSGLSAKPITAYRRRLPQY